MKLFGFEIKKAKAEKEESSKDIKWDLSGNEEYAAPIEPELITEESEKEHEETNLELIHPAKPGFVERVTPKKPGKDVHFYKCLKCKKQHFRHAGYMSTMLPFMRSGGEKRVGMENVQVMVCVSCKSSYIWVNEQMYDVTDKVDINAWEKLEKEVHKCTGPGGNC